MFLIKLLIMKRAWFVKHKHGWKFIMRVPLACW